MKSKFRFQDLEIWKLAIEIADELFEISDELERKHMFRFAEQLRGAAMSISNNIAEGSGSEWKKEFKNFLNIARRSAFECANILILLNHRKILSDDIVGKILDKLDKECRMITNFKKTL
jgi:four helix bundle protein